MSLRTDSNEDVEDVPPPAIPEDADDIPEHDRRLVYDLATGDIWQANALEQDRLCAARELNALIALRAHVLMNVRVRCEQLQCTFTTPDYGETLEQLLLDLGPGDMGEVNVRVLSRRIVYAVQAVHNLGYIHRDLKPANLHWRWARFAFPAWAAAFSRASATSRRACPTATMPRSGPCAPWTPTTRATTSGTTTRRSRSCSRSSRGPRAGCRGSWRTRPGLLAQRTLIDGYIATMERGATYELIAYLNSADASASGIWPVFQHL